MFNIHTRNLKVIADLLKPVSHVKSHIFRTLTLNFPSSSKEDIFPSRRGIRMDNGFFFLKY